MLPNGLSERIFGTPAINTKQAALEAEWFCGTASDAEEPNGRFWVEWVIGRKNKPGEQMEKKCFSRTRD
jgi:hypothetical protein